MTYYRNRQRARLAAKDYMRGTRLRRDSEQLADKSLKDKFACSEWTINRVKNGLPTNVLNEEEQTWVRGCIAEKAVIDRQLPMLTKEHLCHHYQVSREAVDIELNLLGFESPKAKRKKKVSAA